MGLKEYLTNIITPREEYTLETLPPEITKEIDKIIYSHSNEAYQQGFQEGIMQFKAHLYKSKQELEIEDKYLKRLHEMD